MERKLSGRERSELRRQIVIKDPSVCYYCSSKGLKDDDLYCPNCGFPQKGSQAEMKKFLSEMNYKQRLINDHKRAVNKARYMLFAFAIFQLLASIFFIYLYIRFNFSLLLPLVGIITSGIYFGLGIWSKKEPFAAILTGFFIFVLIIAINFIIDPKSLFKGIVLKIIFISGFVYGYKGAKEAESLEKELKEIKQSKDFNQSNDLPELQD
jgi:hypothetical protein